MQMRSTTRRGVMRLGAASLVVAAATSRHQTGAMGAQDDTGMPPAVMTDGYAGGGMVPSSTGEAQFSLAVFARDRGDGSPVTLSGSFQLKDLSDPVNPVTMTSSPATRRSRPISRMRARSPVGQRSMDSGRTRSCSRSMTPPRSAMRRTPSTSSSVTRRCRSCPVTAARIATAAASPTASGARSRAAISSASRSPDPSRHPGLVESLPQVQSNWLNGCLSSFSRHDFLQLLSRHRRAYR